MAVESCTRKTKLAVQEEHADRLKAQNNACETMTRLALAAPVKPATDAEAIIIFSMLHTGSTHETD